MENVVIIGGGMAGLSAAIYLARANLKPLVFAGSPPGGQLTLTSEVENYPGYDSILGAELVEKMRNQAKKFGARIVDENVKSVGISLNQLKMVETSSGKRIETKSIIIATGAKAIWLGLESEKKLRGKGVSACATCDGFFFREKIVAVVGGGDTALEEALTLTKFAKKVYIIHRRESFRASKIMQERVFANKKIEVIWNSAVEEIIGENRVEEVRLKTVKNGLNPPSLKLRRASQLKLDGVFIAIGHKPDTELFRDNVAVDDKGYIITTERIALENLKFEIFNLKSNSNLKNLNIENSFKIKNLKLKISKFDVDYGSQTSVPGVFAAGDCVDYIYQQAVTAAGMGVVSALDVERWLESVEIS